ncbi:MAG: 50S ribosomal protein L35 [Candidatus Lightella neohaematopini]|nr:50S ribosomal protein L35 [Candidatus Lightella neohaematopini]MCV2531319.1 50S ribosomal protein L35 [Candidatus Lightella neohaematopini]
MLKIKTIRSFAKRFRKLSSGKIKYKKSNMRHILIKKTSKQKRQLRSKAMVTRSNLKIINKCLPYL